MFKSSQSSKGKPGGANIMVGTGCHDQKVTEDFSSKWLSCSVQTRFQWVR